MDHGRLDDGLETLIEEYLTKIPDKANQKLDRKEQKLLDSLVRFAEKVLVLANYEPLIQEQDDRGIPSVTLHWIKTKMSLYEFFENLKGGELYTENKRIDTKKAYSRVLQAIGNSIVQADELQHRDEHTNILINAAERELKAANRALARPPKVILDDLIADLREEGVIKQSSVRQSEEQLSKANSEKSEAIAKLKHTQAVADKDLARDRYKTRIIRDTAVIDAYALVFTVLEPSATDIRNAVKDHEYEDINALVAAFKERVDNLDNADLMKSRLLAVVDYLKVLVDANKPIAKDNKLYSTLEELITAAHHRDFLNSVIQDAFYLVVFNEVIPAGYAAWKEMGDITNKTVSVIISDFVKKTKTNSELGNLDLKHRVDNACAIIQSLEPLEPLPTQSSDPRSDVKNLVGIRWQKHAAQIQALRQNLDKQIEKGKSATAELKMKEDELKSATAEVVKLEKTLAKLKAESAKLTRPYSKRQIAQFWPCHFGAIC